LDRLDDAKGKNARFLERVGEKSGIDRIVQQSKPAAFLDAKAVGSIRRAKQSTGGIFNWRYSVFFWKLLLSEQMTKEVLGICLAVISTETGTRLDE